MENLQSRIQDCLNIQFTAAEHAAFMEKLNQDMPLKDPIDQELLIQHFQLLIATKTAQNDDETAKNSNDYEAEYRTQAKRFLDHLQLIDPREPDLNFDPDALYPDDTLNSSETTLNTEGGQTALNTSPTTSTTYVPVERTLNPPPSKPNYHWVAWTAILTAIVGGMWWYQYNQSVTGQIKRLGDKAMVKMEPTLSQYANDNAVLQAAMDSYKDDKYSSAKDFFLRYLDTAPEGDHEGVRDDVHLLVGVCFIYEGNLTEAEVYLKKNLVSPDAQLVAAAKYYLAVCTLKRGRTDLVRVYATAAKDDVPSLKPSAEMTLQELNEAEIQ